MDEREIARGAGAVHVNGHGAGANGKAAGRSRRARSVAAQRSDEDGAELPDAAQGIDPASSDDMASALLDEHATIEQVARRAGLSLPMLARWVRDEAGARALCDLASIGRLFESRTRLRLGRARGDAAEALRRLALDPEGKETARRACVDLLRLDPCPPDGAARGAGVENDEHAGANDEERHAHDELRRLLDRFAQHDEEQGS